MLVQRLGGQLAQPGRMLAQRLGPRGFIFNRGKNLEGEGVKE